MNYEQNDYIEQIKDSNLFFKEYIGEQMMSPFISYPDMKTKYPIEIIDLRHQSDHITPKKIQLFLEYGADPENARFFHRQFPNLCTADKVFSSPFKDITRKQHGCINCRKFQLPFT